MRFDRVYSLVVGQPAGGTGRGPGFGVEITEHRIRFNIRKTDTAEPNQSTIEVFGLARETRQRLQAPDTRVVLKAGYAEENGPVLMFQGDVIYAWVTYEGAEVITHLEVGDGNRAYRDSVVSIGYKERIGSTEILRSMAKQMGLSLSMPNDVPSRSWDNGLSYHGAVRSALDRITRAAGLSWSIQNGVLQIIRTGGNNNREVVELDAQSGLIGSPERQRKSDAEAIQPAAKRKDGTTVTVLQAEEQVKKLKRKLSASRAWDGWRTKSLLLPDLVPGDRIKVNSREVQGVMTVKELVHTGDSRAGDWITDMKLIDPTLARTDKRDQKPSTRTQTRQSNAGGLPLPPPPPPERAS